MTKKRVYAAPETTAPAGVEQGDYLNAQKARRQNAERSVVGGAPGATSLLLPGVATL